MATFTQDPSNSLLAISNSGQVIPIDMLSPNDVVLKPTAPASTTDVASIQAALSPQAAPANTPAVQGVLNKLNTVTAPLNARKQYSIQESTTTQNAINPKVLNRVLENNTRIAEDQARSVEQAGADKRKMAEDKAIADNNIAFGRQVTADQEARDSKQRSEIARANELAFTVQKDPEIQPDRFIRNMSTGTTIATVLLAALNGAANAGLGKKNNEVIDIFNQRIQDDILAQKEAIASGRIRRGNLIAYFQNLGLREEAAEKAAEATSWAMLDRMTQNEKDRIGAAANTTDAKLVGDQIRAQAAQKNDELRITLGTPRSSTTVVKTEKDTSGAGGLENFTKLLAARKAYEESGATPEELKAFDNTMGVPSPSGESEVARGRREASEKRTDDQTKAKSALDALDAFATDAKLVKDPDSKTGEFRANPGDKSILNARQNETMVNAFNPTSSQKINASKKAAIEGFGRLQSGGVIGTDEQARFTDMISGAVTDQQLAEAINSIRRIVVPRVAKLDRPVGGAPGNWK